MRKLIFNLIAAYIYHTPFRPGRSILGRLAYRIFPQEFVADVGAGIKIKVRLDWATDITYWTGTHEKHDELKVFLSYLREGMVVFDVGANIGFYALHFARKVGPNGKVYAFEPVPEYFERLKQHINLNDVTNIIPVPIALSDQKGTAKMSVASGDSSLFHHESDRFIEVPLATLDEFMSEHQINCAHALKLDVEGAELHVIRGANHTIQNFKPIMMVELNATTLKAAGTSPEELFRTIVSYGYRAYVIRNGQAIPTGEVVKPMGYRIWSMTGQKLVFHEFDNYLFLPQ